MKLNMQHSRKRARHDIRSEAAKGIAPQFASRYDVNSMDWVTTANAVGNSQVSKDHGDLRAMLLAISRADPNRAANAIKSFLSDKSNKEVKNGVLTYFQQTDVTNQLIVDGIRESISHHNARGTRTLAAETFVKNVSSACLFEIVKKEKHVNNQTLTSMIGLTWRQLNGERDRAKHQIPIVDFVPLSPGPESSA
mmetsp:Transcript_9128/g.20622  ORF Transcript_9128/g.20622 Transcript_9128/m.20622 type:complete len:194 (-) Transcript_9128:236-817(-)